MAGAKADGVLLRVGTHPHNITAAYHQVSEGARVAGRRIEDITIGVIFHVAVDDDPARALAIGKAIAAGYFEFSPSLFRQLGIDWPGESITSLEQRIFPDFHHARDLVAAGAAVDFARGADAFALGDPDTIAAQCNRAPTLCRSD
jgi:alkanesulfonate monooxygenase SsuD/methylene tetrahydromethanopterin reductase-like flavin-dependent oxidoreductase (luciferase family)